MSLSGSHVRPNILWISLEDTSPRFGCYGDAVARTPHLDRLAAEGARYPNAFSTAGVCAPSRCAIITGVYQTAIGGHHMRTAHRNVNMPELPTPYEVVPPPYVKAFPEYLRAAGYYCTNNEKTDYQFDPPLTAWDECSAKGHWRNRGEGQPFFSVFNVFVTHESGMWEKEPYAPPRTDPAAVVLPPYLPDTPKVRLALARHYDNLETADRRVGELLRELEEDGLADDTIVMVWSDHGEGLPRAKRWTYDAGIRVPLLVRWPGVVAAGTVNERLVSMIDLAPTVLGLAGVAVPQHLHGKPFLGPAEEEPRKYVYATRDRYDEAYDMVRAVRDQRFKYIRNYEPGKPYLLWIPYSYRHAAAQELWRLRAEGALTAEQQLLFRPRPAEELYDCAADPLELRNLADDAAYAGKLEELRDALNEWRRRYGDLGDLPEEQMVRGMWPGGVQPQTAAPLAVPFSATAIGVEPLARGDGLVADVRGPVLLMLQSATQGASIVYTLDEGEQPRWLLYTEPLAFEATVIGGEAPVCRLRAKAVRIGFKDSEEAAYSFRVLPHAEDGKELGRP